MPTLVISYSKISKVEVDYAMQKLHGDLVDQWNEEFFYNVTNGIKEEKLEQYADSVLRIIKVEKESGANIKEMIMQMQFAEDSNTNIYQFGGKVNEFDTMYGYIALVKGDDGKISCVYAVHKLMFKMADRKIRTTKTKYAVGFIPWGSTTTTSSQVV